ncbi:MAG: phenylalanine--tRNA ligase subunit alpha [Kiritimatiellia bacterium]
MTLVELEALQEQSLAELRAAPEAAGLEQVRVRYLGRNGLIPAMMKQLKDVPAAERPEFGRRANAWRTDLEAELAARQAAAAPREAVAPFDVTLPGRWHTLGTMHPVSRVIEEVCRVFARLGFTVADGPDIETRFNNFTALNTPAHHPSLDDTDTFWLGADQLLRTQTSPVQIRMMTAHPPPLRIVTPGRCYRRDTTDATHSANFHQIEGLYVDTKPVSLADLKATLACFARETMGPSVGVRFRPHFFPFTEPSVEVDFSCHVCGGTGCRVCKMSGWIEIAGAGMVDPRVYKHVGYDPEKVYGYAFGMGVERIAMIKYGITDIRHLYENDVRYLGQFA